MQSRGKQTSVFDTSCNPGILIDPTTELLDMEASNVYGTWWYSPISYHPHHSRLDTTTSTIPGAYPIKESTSTPISNSQTQNFNPTPLNATNNPTYPPLVIPSYPQPMLPTSYSPTYPSPTLQQDSKPRCFDHGCSGRRFASKSNLERHRKERANPAVARTQASCPLCGAVFTRNSARDTHLAKQSCNRIRRYSNGRLRPSRVALMGNPDLAAAVAAAAGQVQGVGGWEETMM